ncbi:histone-fold-containing protein, partial [Blastocladiella britannica]
MTERSVADLKSALPLLRVKKVMKVDPDVTHRVTTDANAVLARAAELFIAELTKRAWTVAELNKRRTLHRSDVLLAVAKAEQYDFLIDLVPR